VLSSRHMNTRIVAVLLACSTVVASAGEPFDFYRPLDSFRGLTTQKREGAISDRTLELLSERARISDARTANVETMLRLQKEALRSEERALIEQHAEQAREILLKTPLGDRKAFEDADIKIMLDYPKCFRDREFQITYMAYMDRAQPTKDELRETKAYFAQLNAEEDRDAAPRERVEIKTQDTELSAEVRKLRAQAKAAEERAAESDRRLNATQREVEYQRSRLNSVNQTFRDAGIQPGRSSFGP